MSGPPGLGKTTLAHVVARQAGYDVFEINARWVHASCQSWIGSLADAFPSVMIEMRGQCRSESRTRWMPVPDCALKENRHVWLLTRLTGPLVATW